MTGRNITITLGTNEHDRRKTELERIANEVCAIGYHGEPAISTLIQMIADGNLEVRMKKVTADVSQTDEYQCPHCGENYIDRHLHEDAGNTFVSVCDGHEGCGKRFKLSVIGE